MRNEPKRGCADDREDERCETCMIADHAPTNNLARDDLTARRHRT
jgi:hypothetical protein